MTDHQDRDVATDRLLRQTLGPSPAGEPTPSCLDAEILAAWAEDGLSAAARHTAEAHLAECTYCQSMLSAFVHTDSPVPIAAPERATPGWFSWVVPASAVAAAMLSIWLLLPNDEASTIATSPPSAPTQMADARAADDKPLAAAASEPRQDQSLRDEMAPPREAANEPRMRAAASAKAEASEVQPPAAPVPPGAPAVEARQSLERAASADVQEAPAGSVEESARVQSRVEADADAPPPAARAAAPLAATGAGRAGAALARAATITVALPDGTLRYRLVAGREIQRSDDNGASWQQLFLDDAALLVAGAAPSRDVCWVVGRAGLVWLTTDGRTFRRVAPPSSADITNIRSADGSRATVTQSDGRVFSTTNGGATWVSGPLQGF